MAHVILSAQNIDIYEGDELHPFARTGALSSWHVGRAGAKGVVVGHSEIGDTEKAVKGKLHTVLNEGLEYSTLLVGETWEETTEHAHEDTATLVAGRLSRVLEGLSFKQIKNLVIGYEPRWGTFGSGKDDVSPPSVELVFAVGKKLKSTLTELYPKEGETIPLIYGGRSTPERAAEMLGCEFVEGLILGSACDSVEKTIAIASSMAEKRSGRKILHANFKAMKLEDSYVDYVGAFEKLDDSFIVYVSPPATDLREVSVLLK